MPERSIGIDGDSEVQLPVEIERDRVGLVAFGESDFESMMAGREIELEDLGESDLWTGAHVSLLAQDPSGKPYDHRLADEPVL